MLKYTKRFIPFRYYQQNAWISCSHKQNMPKSILGKFTYSTFKKRTVGQLTYYAVLTFLPSPHEVKGDTKFG